MSAHHEKINGFAFFSIDTPDEPLMVCETCGSVVILARTETHATWHRALLVMVSEPPPNPSDPFRSGRRRRV